jgi:hypothetical protein
MTKDHGPHIKDDATYEALREDGASRQKAARIANAQADPDRDPATTGGHASPYEDWTRDNLYDRARDIGIEGRSDMRKAELIKALRNH